MRASLMESWMVDITLGVFSMASPRRRIAAVRVAATRSAKPVYTAPRFRSRKGNPCLYGSVQSRQLAQSRKEEGMATDRREFMKVVGATAAAVGAMSASGVAAAAEP